MLCDLYLSDPMVTCYDNEGEGGGDGGQTDSAGQNAGQDGGDKRAWRSSKRTWWPPRWFTGYEAQAGEYAVVEKADYNSDTRSIDFECWTPVKAGQMEPYDFAYPADVSQELRFPTPIEEEEEFDGGTGIGRNATGALPIRYDLRRGVRVEYDGNPDPFGFEAAKRSTSDRGDPKPSDQGDKHPGEPVVGSGVVYDERLPGVETPVFENTGFYQVAEPTLLDIATTKIIDSRDPGGDEDNITTFSTFFAEISDGKLKMATDATLVDANDREVQGTFDFKYDEETEQFGAGTAFLQEEDE